MSASAPDLTRTERSLLEVLAFCRTLGMCWLVPTGYGREALVVPTMLVGGPLERHSAYNSRTLGKLGQAGLISRGATMMRRCRATATGTGWTLRDGPHSGCGSLTKGWLGCLHLRAAL